jgi:hypothetical protein
VNPRKSYERRQAIWSLISYCLLGLMTAGVVFYGAIQSGLVRLRRGR